MIRNIRYALRMLGKNRGFTAVAVVTLGLGIGANTTIFSLINSLLLRPLPYKNPGELVALNLASGQSQFPWSYPMFDELRRDQRVFSSVAGFSDLDVNLTGVDAPERLRCELVSAAYFPLLGIEAEKGRLFRPEEDREPDSHPVALLGNNLWRQKFGGDPALIGRTINLNQFRYTVVGVLPAGFKGQSGDIEIWVPITMAPSLFHIPERLTAARTFWMGAMGRLKSGVPPGQAGAQMQALSAEVERAYPHPGAMSRWQVKATSLAEAKSDPAIRNSLLVLFGAVGFVLLIACVNMANLLMSRGVSRQKEIAVRLAIGAGRRALIAQLLTESVILGLLGGFIGFFIAAYAIDLAAVLRPEASGGPWFRYARALGWDAIRMDAWVVAFNIALSVLAGVVFGLLPALESSRLDLNQALKDVSSGWARRLGSLRGLNPRSVLITSEMALAVMLLAGAGLMIESFTRLLQTRLGVNTGHILTAHVDLPPQKYPAAAAVRFDEQLVGLLKGARGVESAAVGNSLPARGENEVAILRMVGKEEAVGVHVASDDYFRVFHIPLLSGRLFNERDRAGAPKVLVVNETAARRFWPGENPVGKHASLTVWDAGAQDAEVVGVAGDVRFDSVEKPAMGGVYVSFRQYPEAGNIVVRTAGNPAGAAQSIVRAVHALDRDLPVYGIKTMDQQLAAATSRARFSTVLLGVFASLALVLAAVGLYGVVAYSVAARTREVGIRMALGAERSDVLKLVVGDGLLLALAGLAAGIPLGLAATRVLTSFLYGTRPGDPLAFAGVSLLLVAVAVVASYVPARRAAKVDPLVALRYE